MNPEEFVLLKTFTYPHELAVIRGKLESEGIVCIVQDELIVQANPFSSNAVGGIKLKVKETDLVEAMEILKEAGYNYDSPIGDKRFQLQNMADSLSGSIENASSWLAGSRRSAWITIVVVLVALVGGLYYFLTPHLPGALTNNEWCVDHVIYNSEDYLPHTKYDMNTSFHIGISKSLGGLVCEDEIVFDKSGALEMPGFNAPPNTGTWKLDGKTMRIEIKQGENNFVYNGVYTVKLEGGRLVLTSAATTIFCYQIK